MGIPVETMPEMTPVALEGNHQMITNSRAKEPFVFFSGLYLIPFLVKGLLYRKGSPI